MQKRGLVNSLMPASPKGRKWAVLVPINIWRRLQATAKPSLKNLLLSDEARGEWILPARRQAKRRPVKEIL